MGEELAKAELHAGGRPAALETSRSDLPVFAPTLAEIGISKDQSSRYQHLAAIPTDVFDAAPLQAGSMPAGAGIPAGASRPPSASGQRRTGTIARARRCISAGHAAFCPGARSENLIMTKLICTTLALLGLLASAPLLTACHTTSGAGQDISNTGKAIENSADKHTPLIPQAAVPA